MTNKLTAEQIEKLKTCKTVEEVKVLAEKENIELTEAAAASLFPQLNPESGELADAELETVVGGADWHYDAGERKYYRNDGSLMTGWHYDTSGQVGRWFYFNENGIMQTGFHYNIPGYEGRWFYFDETGEMKTGWFNTEDGNWIYLDPM